MSKYNQLKAQLVALISEKKQMKEFCRIIQIDSKISETKKEMLVSLKCAK